MKRAERIEKELREFLKLEIQERNVDMIWYPKEYRWTGIMADVSDWMRDAADIDLSGQELADLSRRAVTFLRTYAEKMRAAEAEVLGSL